MKYFLLRVTYKFRILENVEGEDNSWSWKVLQEYLSIQANDYAAAQIIAKTCYNGISKVFIAAENQTIESHVKEKEDGTDKK
jgi:hypothetical protein